MRIYRRWTIVSRVYVLFDVFNRFYALWHQNASFSWKSLLKDRWVGKGFSNFFYIYSGDFICFIIFLLDLWLCEEIGAWQISKTQLQRNRDENALRDPLTIKWYCWWQLIRYTEVHIYVYWGPHNISYIYKCMKFAKQT